MPSARRLWRGWKAPRRRRHRHHHPSRPHRLRCPGGRCPMAPSVAAPLLTPEPSRAPAHTALAGAGGDGLAPMNPRPAPPATRRRRGWWWRASPRQQPRCCMTRRARGLARPPGQPPCRRETGRWGAVSKPWAAPAGTDDGGGGPINRDILAGRPLRAREAKTCVSGQARPPSPVPRPGR